MALSADQLAAQNTLDKAAGDAQIIVKQLQAIQHEQESMLSTGWKGDSAGKYGKTSIQHQEKFDDIIKNLNHAVTTARGHLAKINSMDQS
jgi:hypothetical protein